MNQPNPAGHSSPDPSVVSYNSRLLSEQLRLAADRLIEEKWPNATEAEAVLIREAVIKGAEVALRAAVLNRVSV